MSTHVPEGGVENFEERKPIGSLPIKLYLSVRDSEVMNELGTFNIDVYESAPVIPKPGQVDTTVKYDHKITMLGLFQTLLEAAGGQIETTRDAAPDDREAQDKWFAWQIDDFKRRYDLD